MKIILTTFPTITFRRVTRLFNFLLVIMCLFVQYSCSKRTIPDSSNNTPVNTDPVLAITIDETHPGINIPVNFQGLSYETSTIATNSPFLNANNTVLIQLVKNLGPGVLRIGGNSSDDFSWSGTVRSSTTAANTLTTSDINNLSSFAKAVNWPVLFGLNLGNYDPANAASEAKYVFSALQGNFLAFQAGNEPDGYHSWNPKRTSSYDYAAYKPEWESYFNAVRGQVPNAPFAGPDIAYQSSWVSSFASDENKNVILLDGHYYQSGPASDPTVTYHNLFSVIPAYPGYFTILNTAAQNVHLPYRISECNSINGGGKTGVSDVFASTLWALDFMWMVASNNGQGVNFHGGSGGAYSPFALNSGQVVARPEYYAMLAFKYAAAGAAIVPTNLSNQSYHCRAYACSKSGITAITIINEENQQNLNFKISLTNKFGVVHIARLTAPSITATSGISFSGSVVNADGTFQVGKTEDYSNDTNEFSVSIPAASAAVIIVQ